MGGVLISTVYRFEPVIASATKLSPDKIILLIDEKPDEKMQQSVSTIKKTLGAALHIETISTDVYDIVKVASKVVDIIDSIPHQDEVYVDVTTGRKTKSLGLLFGAYARSSRVRKITYVTEEEKRVVSLPKMSYNLTEGQRKVIEYMRKGSVKSVMDMADKLDISRGAVYRHIKELKDLDIIEETSQGFSLTDFGRIVVL